MRPKVRFGGAVLVDPSTGAQVGPNQMSTTARGGVRSEEHTQKNVVEEVTGTSKTD